MRTLVLFSAVSFVAAVSFAQTVDVNNVSTNEETTIHIKKGAPGNSAACDCRPQYEITEGDEEVIGDGAMLAKEAQSNWKKACNEWKSELKDMNKGNQIITVNCGSSTCSPSNSQTICKSTAKYKVKVKLTQ